MTKIQKELELIRKTHGGLLRPADVVAYAADPETSLHAKFTWDDSSAAEKFRLWQAREIIRVTVRMVPHTNKTFRAYVSFKEDRAKDNGYRRTSDVLKSRPWREKMLEEALEELQTFQRKYALLAELAPVFEAIGKIKKAESRGLRIAAKKTAAKKKSTDMKLQLQ